MDNFSRQLNPDNCVNPIRTRSRPRWLRYGAPASLSIVGIWLLVGCIYLPIPEHSSNWSQKNFFPLIDANNTSSPIRRGQITRAGAIKLLGPPAFEIPESRAIVYGYDTERDAIIWPLCFVGQAGYKNSFAVKFNFDGNDRLVDWETKADLSKYGGAGLFIIRMAPDATRYFRPDRPELPPATSPTTR